MIDNTRELKMKNITEKALMSRINRKLAHDGERLKKLRGERWYASLGTYFIVDGNNFLIDPHVDPEYLARELGVLSDSEKLAEAAV